MWEVHKGRAGEPPSFIVPPPSEMRLECALGGGVVFVVPVVFFPLVLVDWPRP
jgi:hypothetical protein